MRTEITDRRKFILTMARGTGLALMGGFVWSAFLDEATAAKLVLRPPAALPEKEFIAACIKCGLCTQACPFDMLLLAKPGDNLPLGTPYYIPRNDPCRMCEDIPCVPVCPTDALDESRVSNEKGELDYKEMKMGVAVVDATSCIAFWGIQCDACYRACPLLGEAITLEYSRNERTSKHAYAKPVINADICTGCGLCEQVCVTKKAAIFVLPTEVALGTVDNHYVKGWDKRDQERVKDAVSETTTTDISKKSAIDSLNDSEGLY